MKDQQLTIGWKVATLNPAIASLRYRALLPMLALDSLGINSKIFSRVSWNCLSGVDLVVIVKSFTVEDYWLAQEAIKMKVPVIFDLCDNIFIDQYQSKKQTSPADMFIMIASIANAIVVTTEPLASIVREKIGGRIPVYVVPDGMETTITIAAAKKLLWLPQLNEYLHRLLTESEFSKLLRQSRNKLGLFKIGSFIGVSRSLLKDAVKFMRRPHGGIKNKLFQCYLNWYFWAKLAPNAGKPAAMSPSLRKIVWFGNHGADHANFGMLDLLYIREQLEKLTTEFYFELVVISNNLAKYNKHIRPISVSSRYIEWSAEAVVEHLQSADVAVIPNSLDDFSICKSANRTVKALAHGVPVVATFTPALEELRECIVLDDFEDGLRRYLTDADFAKMHVQRGRERIAQLYGQHVIGRLWNELINEVAHGRDSQNTAPSPELIVAIHLPQDIDLATPVLDVASQRGISCTVWISLAAIQRWSQVTYWIRNLRIDWHIFPDDLKGFDASMFPDSVYALLTVSETNLGPHRFTHHLTKLANAAGLYTATMQHGYENVGLSYSDELHNIKHIKFASRKIFTWGNLEMLHPNIPQKTLNKCYPVGCPKPDSDAQELMEDWMSNGPVIGIFENLHWHRYSDEYREFFLEGIQCVADAFPRVNFLIKTHNAGMWLISCYQGNKPEKNNIIIIDPKDPQYTSLTVPRLFVYLDGVITTPSTVALDAARAKMPVAVVAQGMDLKNYEPLPLLQCRDDWIDFVSQVVDAHGHKKLQEKSLQFVERVLLPGNAAWRIVREIESHNPNGATRNTA